MELFYSATCATALIFCLVLGWLSRPQSSTDVGAPEGFRKFQIKFLTAWAVCVGADWLQGPYVYALYDAYGFQRSEIAQLFVAGFGASFVFGTFVAGFADTFGRKKSILLYCVLYIISCMSKHFNSYEILMVGRVTGGIATSILFSAFESWLVYEHCTRHKFERKLLGYNFSIMYFVNYLVAIIAGLGSQSAVDSITMSPYKGNLYFGGFLIAFDIAIVCLLVGGAYVAANWEENYGARAEGPLEVIKSFGRSTYLICTNLRMALCCVVVALFEASMFIFVFNWTPVLSKGEAPPFGLVFSTMMMCCMCGASVTTLCSSYKNTVVLQVALALAAGTMLLPAYGGISEALTMYNFWAFLAFEFCVGMYFPTVCALKSECVAEGNRTQVYNLFRAPMNAIVVVVLLVNPDLVPTFQLIFHMLLVAAVLVGMMVFGPSGPKPGETQPILAEVKTKGPPSA